MSEMSADDVLEILAWFEEAGIEVFIDGGWGVDALLKEQTRTHDDLDIALDHGQVPALRQLLLSKGFEEVPRDDSWECNFVFGDRKSRLIDVHSYLFDEDDKHIFGVAYAMADLTGFGTIEGRSVRCICPESMVKFHTGYTLDDNDFKDVSALCSRFSLSIPPEYGKWLNQPLGDEESCGQ